MPRISVRTFKTAVETSQIYKKIERNGRIMYHYFPQNDTVQQDLIELSNQYKKSPSKKLKKQILRAERKILYTELENPELTLVRNAKKIIGGIKKNLNFDKLLAWVQDLNVDGIYRMDVLKGFRLKINQKRIEKLKSAFVSLKENNEQGINTKLHIMDVLSWHSKHNALKELSKTTKSQSIKSEIRVRTSKLDYDYKSAINSLTQNPLQLNKLKTFLRNLGKESVDNKATKSRRKAAAKIIKDILTKDNVPPSIKRVAVWGAGKYKSDKAFDIIKQIALNPDEKDIRLREFALHSTAFYIKRKPKEVKQILSKVEQDGTMFSPLATILKDKVNGTYHGQKNREYNYLNIDEKSISKHKKHVANLINMLDCKNNTHIQNEIDRSMLFFRTLFKNIKFFKGFILSDTSTRIMLNKTGKRLLGKYPKTNTGCFMDAVDGCCSYNQKTVIMSHDNFQSRYHFNSLAHEYGHCWHNKLNNKDYAQVRKLYKSAVKSGRALDWYADLNEKEYFAQGCEAMSSIYKPHSDFMAIDDNYNHTRYELLSKDPKLYHFIEKMIQKYSK